MVYLDMPSDVSLLIAFSAGLVSFLSPCVVPIVPGFLAYLAGVSLDRVGREEGDAGQRARAQRAIFVNSLFFVIGFSVVFAVLGVLLNTLLGVVAYEVQRWLARLGGVLVIFFGLYLMGLIRIRAFEQRHTPRVSAPIRSRLGTSQMGRYATSFLFGFAFAAGWTPCVGAALGAILGLAASKPGTAFGLLFAYALGLGLPFLCVGLFAARAARLIDRYASVLGVVNRVFGAVLVVLGVLVFTQSLNLLFGFSWINYLL